MITRQFAKDLSVSTGYHVMKMLGLSTEVALSGVAARHSSDTHVGVLDLCGDSRRSYAGGGAMSYVGDESRVRPDYQTYRTLALQSQTPVLQAVGRSFSLNMISVVSTHGDFRLMLY